MMRFDNLSQNEQSVLDLVRKVGQARQADEALRRGDSKTIWVDDDVLVYTRHTSGAARLVALNHRGSQQRRHVPLPVELEITDGTRFSDVLCGAALTALAGHLDVDLAPMTSAIHLPQK